jgi:hypothetical protein
MENKNLELRMFGFVPYNISEIQKGIQYGHAKDEYERKFRNTELYNDWADNWKTYIIKNGGTTNLNKESKFYGSLNKILDILNEQGIDLGAFYEPDLGDQLTGIALIADERVFNNDNYPMFAEFIRGRITDIQWLQYFKNGIAAAEQAIEELPEEYAEWVELIGGPKNVFLKSYLPKFRLA